MLRVLCFFSSLLLVAESRFINEASASSPFELNEFFRGTFSTSSFNGSWVSGNTFLYRTINDDYLSFDATTKTSSPYVDSSILTNYPGGRIVVSSDLVYIAIRYNVSSVFRHSTTAVYAIYDTLNDNFYDIANKNHIQTLTWSPEGHSLVYVYENNIYYLETPENAENPIAITTDGDPGVIYNGVPDWVYEEEVLGSGSALWFSPNGKRIAFASFNDTEVEEMTYFLYGTPGSSETLYPTPVTLKYPKVGSTNPTVKTYLVDLESPTKLTELKAIPERFLANNNYVLYDMTWPINDEVAVISTNRVQNEAELVRCSLDGSCRHEASYIQENGWLDPRIPKYNKDGTLRLEILPQPEDGDFFDHLVLINVTSGISVRLTDGKFVVTSIYGWDEDNGLVYFVGSGENAPSQQHVYAVSVISFLRQCLTCEMQTCTGVCKYASASFSTDLSYWVKICQGPGPYHVEVQKSVATENVEENVVWEDNAPLIDRLLTKSMPLIKDLKVPVANGFLANVRLLLPPDLDEYSPQKYPAIVNVYGGPASNQIRDSYSSGVQNYVVTNRKYIYIYIDGRGSGRDGRKKMFQMYRGMGTVEIDDQIAVTKYLQDNLPYIDADNTGIWGWSYGGFASAWALVKDSQNVFKFGLSVAPVTSFIYYDTIYTERYMGLPTEDDNLAGYNNTDLTRNVEAMRGKLFFLIHGNADDNVHYQQSMLLSRALELADIPFRQQSYPDENHSLGSVYPHLYHTIDRFWARSFGLPDPPTASLLHKEDIG